MTRLCILLLALMALTGVARADDTPPMFYCPEYSSSVCNESTVPGGMLNDALDHVYTTPSVIASWRLAQSPGVMNPRFIQPDGTAGPDSFLSGVTMPAAGVGNIIRVNQTGGDFAIDYVLQVNGVDTDLWIAYDEFSPSFNSDYFTYVTWSAGDVLTLKVIDASPGEAVKAYVTIGGYFL
jgi:hypothetical protein